MELNAEENVDPTNLVVQRIIINNFEIKTNNFVTSNREKEKEIKEISKVENENDITIIDLVENYSNYEKNNGQNNKKNENIISDIPDFILDKKLYISCKVCKNIIGFEGII